MTQPHRTIAPCFISPKNLPGGRARGRRSPPLNFFLNFSVGGTEGAASTPEKYSRARVKGLCAIRFCSIKHCHTPPDEKRTRRGPYTPLSRRGSATGEQGRQKSRAPLACIFFDREPCVLRGSATRPAASGEHIPACALRLLSPLSCHLIM